MKAVRLSAALLGLALCQAGCVTTPDGGSTGLPSQEQPKKEELKPEQKLEAALSLAKTMEQNGNFQDAIENYERVRTQQPHNIVVVRHLARLYDRTAQFDKAEADYRVLAKATPRDASLYNDWGRSWYLRNNWKESEAKLRQALQLDPKLACAHCNLAMTLGQQEHFPEALKEFLAADLNEAQAHSNLAFVYWSQHKFAEARQECQQALQLDPSAKKPQELLVLLDPNKKPMPKPNQAERGPRRQTPEQSTPGQPAPLTADAGLPNAPSGDSQTPVLRTSGGVGWIPVASAPDRRN